MENDFEKERKGFPWYILILALCGGIIIGVAARPVLFPAKQVEPESSGDFEFYADVLRSQNFTLVYNDLSNPLFVGVPIFERFVGLARLYNVTIINWDVGYYGEEYFWFYYKPESSASATRWTVP